jgi:hypothetical protein
MKKGICRICGENKELSYEHVPPRAAYNDKAVVFHKIEDILNKSPDELRQTKGKILQKGSGAYTLCVKCNNDTGGWYGNAFADFAYQGMSILHHTGNRPSLYYNFQIFPMRVLKQIICMFFSMNADRFQSIHTGLVKYVLNPLNDYFESDVKVYLFYSTSYIIRKSGVSALMNLSGKSNVFSELTYPPFGYVDLTPKIATKS